MVGREPPLVGVVLLSMGTRRDELDTAIASLARQQGVRLDVVLVGNGWEPEGLPSWIRTVYEPENIGVPAGRNLGASLVEGDYIFFCDDDGELPTEYTLRNMVLSMAPDVAVVQPRGVDLHGKPSPRRWVPRLVTKRTAFPGDAVVFWEAMALVRRRAFDEIGGWPGEFFFGHEGIDLAMRLSNLGWRVRYQPDIVVYHPSHPPTRHAVYYHTNARNRAWVARRNLPAPLPMAYIAVWVIATVARVHDPKALRHWFAGLREGLSGPVPGGRNPVSWAAVARMTRLGRPPIW